MKFIESVKKMLPGCAIALVIAVVAKFLEQLEESVGLHLIGASVIAMFIGMIVNRFYAPNDKTKPGIKFTSKKILKFAIILLGASLNITTVLTVGKFSLTVMLFTLATCFGLGYVIGKALGLDWKTSSLINAGTGICGGSAIAAIAPVIEATDMDIAYGMSATFLFDTIMVVVFPLLGRATTLKSISKFLMVAALAAIGLNTNFAALCKSGAKPMLHGFIISLLVVLVAIAVEYVLGIAPSGTLI